MFGDNLVVLHRSLRKAGILEAPEASALFRSDDRYGRFLSDTEGSLALYRGPGKRPTGPLWKGEWRGQ